MTNSQINPQFQCGCALYHYNCSKCGAGCVVINKQSVMLEKELCVNCFSRPESKLKAHDSVCKSPQEFMADAASHGFEVKALTQMEIKIREALEEAAHQARVEIIKNFLLTKGSLIIEMHQGLQQLEISIQAIKDYLKL